MSRLFLSKNDDKKGRRKKGGKTLEQLVKEYRLADNMSVFKVSAGSGQNRKTISELDIHNNYGLFVFEVRSENSRHSCIIMNVAQRSAGPETILSANDLIYITGDREQRMRFAEEYALEICSN